MNTKAQRLASKKWKLNNPSKVREQAKRYRERHPDAIIIRKFQNYLRRMIKMDLKEKAKEILKNEGVI